MSSFRLGGLVPLAAVAAVCAMTPAKALTLIDVSGPNSGLTTGATALSNNPGVGFSLAADYNNVSITVPLVSFFGGGNWNLEAFLTTQIGPGTTPIPHQVASVSQSITLPDSSTSLPFNLTPMTIFSGLNLTAGNYYLTLSGTLPGTFATSYAWWVGTWPADLTTSTSGGSAVILGEYQMSVVDPYLPASFYFSISQSTPEFMHNWFTVTGDPVDNAVPEPTTTALTLIGGLVLIHLRRSTPRHQ